MDRSRRLKSVISDADRLVMERFNRKYPVLNENISTGRFREDDIVREVVNTSIPIVFKKLRHHLDKGNIDHTDYMNDDTVTSFMGNFTSLFTVIMLYNEGKKELTDKLWSSIKDMP